MSEALIITGSMQITAADEARAQRDDLLTQAASVTTVADRIDADSATAVLRELKAYAARIEEARSRAKAPALEIGRKIDALAKELVAAVTTEAGRIAKVVGAYELEEKRKADEARYAAEAEARRIAQEAERAAAKARAAAPDALAADRAADAIAEKAVAQVVAVRQQAATVAPARQTGTQVREDVCFEVTDIRALYQAHPELVTLEPNGTAIRAILRANPNLQVPGLRHWREAKLSVRS